MILNNLEIVAKRGCLKIGIHHLKLKIQNKNLKEKEERNEFHYDAFLLYCDTDTQFIETRLYPTVSSIIDIER